MHPLLAFIALSSPTPLPWPVCLSLFSSGCLCPFHKCHLILVFLCFQNVFLSDCDSNQGISDQISLFWFRESRKTTHSLCGGIISSLFYKIFSLCRKTSGLVLWPICSTYVHWCKCDVKYYSLVFSTLYSSCYCFLLVLEAREANCFMR